MPGLIECYDVGGTKILGALMQKNGKITRAIECKTIKGSPKALIMQIRDLSKALRESVSSEFKIAGVSLGLPGPVENGFLLESAPMKINSKFNVARELGRHFKEPVFIANDLKAAAKAELNFGLGKTVKKFFLLAISTGIGSGLVMNGKAMDCFFGEFGHTTLERDLKKAKKCSCNRLGCWAAMSSGFGIESIIEKELKTRITVEDFFRLSESDKKIKKIVWQIRDYNAQGIGNMLNAFSVDAIVLMGSIALNQFDKIIPKPREIKKYTIGKVPKIVPSKLGSKIGLLGAFVFADEKLGRQ